MSADVNIPTNPGVTLDPDDYEKVVKADIGGDERATAYLANDLDSWVRGLQGIVQDVQAQFTRRKADDEQFRQECRAMGKPGQAAWYDRSAATVKWRGSANAFLRHAQERLREVKEMQRQRNIQEARTGNDGERLDYGTLLLDAIARLERIEAMLGERGC